MGAWSRDASSPHFEYDRLSVVPRFMMNCLSIEPKSAHGHVPANASVSRNRLVRHF